MSKGSREQRAKQNRWIPEYRYVIFRINEEGIFANSTLDLEDDYPVSTIVFTDYKNNLYISGVYTDGNKDELGYGVFLMKYGKNHELKSFEQNRFGNEIENGLMEKRKNKRWRTLSHFPINALVIDYEKGSFSLVLENRYFSSHIEKDQLSIRDESKIEYTYYSDDLIISNLTFEGEPNWFFHLPKYYVSNDYRKTKSVGSTKGGNIFLVYNHFKTKEESLFVDHTRKRNLFSYYTDVLKINPNGEVIFEETIFHSRDLEKPFVPMISEGLSNGNILLQCQDKRVFQFGTLKFN